MLSVTSFHAYLCIFHLLICHLMCFAIHPISRESSKPNSSLRLSENHQRAFHISKWVTRSQQSQKWLFFSFFFLFLFLSFVSNVFESLIGERLGRTSGIGFHNKHHKSRIMEDLGGSWRILDSAKKKERWRGRGRGARCWNKPIKQTWNKARNVLLSASTAAIVVVVICAVERTGSPRFGNGEITTRKKKTHQDVYLRIALAFVEEEMLQRRSSPQTPNILRPLFPKL